MAPTGGEPCTVPRPLETTFAPKIIEYAIPLIEYAIPLIEYAIPLIEYAIPLLIFQALQRREPQTH